MAGRPEIIGENKDIKFGEVGKKLGEEWRSMDEAARQPFKDVETKETERFDAEMLAYNEPVRTTHALCTLLFAPRMPSSMTDDQGTFADLAYPCTCVDVNDLSI